MPIITFIDTPGAYPRVGAEERAEPEAIARNLRERCLRPERAGYLHRNRRRRLGGALAIGAGDKVNMLSMYSTYSVIFAGRLRLHSVEERDKAPLAGKRWALSPRV